MVAQKVEMRVVESVVLWDTKAPMLAEMMESLGLKKAEQKVGLMD